MTVWINQNRERNGWSIREFGRRIGVSHTHAARIANGDIEPSADLCIKIAEAFNVAPETVMRKAGILGPEPSETAGLIEANRLFAQLTDEERRMKIVEMRALIERRRSAELATDAA